MRKMTLLPLGALLLATTACTTMSTARVATFVTGAIAAETAAAIRCPRAGTERTVFLVGRIAVDATIGARMSPEQRTALDAARRATDQVCGFTQSERMDAQAAAAAENIND